MPDEWELTPEELQLLREVVAGKILHTRGKFKKLQPGSPDVSMAVQLLRTKQLVRLVDVSGWSRVPPSRLCEPTRLGRQILAQHRS